MAASLVEIKDYAGQGKALGSNIIYGDDLKFQVTFNPEVVLSGYNYIVRYYFYLNGVEFKTEQIDKDAKEAFIVIDFADAGSYNVKVVVSVVISHYMGVAKETELSFEIGKKTVAFAFSNLEYTYDKSAHFPTVSLVDGSVYAEDLAVFDWTLSDSAKINAGNYGFEVASINNSNYVISGNVRCDYVIKQRPINIVWDSRSAYYNARPQVPRYTLSGILSGDVAAIEEVVYQNMVNAGTYTINIDRDSVTNDNYYVENVDNITFEIKPAELVLTLQNAQDRASRAPINRQPVTYTIQGTVYETVAQLNIKVVCDALDVDKNIEDVGEYVITATYSNSNYNITVVDAVYTLLGSYRVVYKLPNGEMYIEEVTQGENPVGISDEVYKAGFLKKLVYSEELVYDNGKDIDVVVTEEWDMKALVILGVAGVFVVVVLYLAATRKARRNKVR